MLMRIAEAVDSRSPELREWFMTSKEAVMEMLREDIQHSRQLREAAATTAPSSGEGLRLRKRGSAPQKEGAVGRDTVDPLLQDKRNIVQAMRMFLARYGFRCINELKLEEHTLHDDPGRCGGMCRSCDSHVMVMVYTCAGFVYEMISGYVRSKAYSISDMEEREVGIRTAAEKVVKETLPIHQRLIFNWVLFHARRGKQLSSCIEQGCRHFGTARVIL